MKKIVKIVVAGLVTVSVLSSFATAQKKKGLNLKGIGGKVTEQIQEQQKRAEEEQKQKEAAEAKKRAEEEKQQKQLAEAEKKRQEEEEKQKAEEERQKLIAEALKQEPVTPAASEFVYDIASDGGIKITRYLGTGMCIKIPEKIEGVTVTEIARNDRYYHMGDFPLSAFYEASLVKVFVPNTVVRMNFSGCRELREVILEDGIKYISEGAFSDCANLKSIKLARGLQRIGYGAFQNSGLESIDIPDSVTLIDKVAFRGCENLKSVKLPAGLKELGGDRSEIDRAGVFAGSGLESIVLPNSLTTIRGHTFEGCENLKSVTLPTNLGRIERDAFKGCRALSEIIIPDTLKRISFGWESDSRYTFSNCNFSLATKSKLRTLGYEGEF